MRYLYKEDCLYVLMKSSILLLFFVIMAAGVSATSTTTLFQGTPKEVYDINNELVTTANCEKIAEKEVLVLTQVYADEDNQTDFPFTFELPGKPPYGQYKSLLFGQHRIFVYVPNTFAVAQVNGRWVDRVDADGGIWTSHTIAGDSIVEQIKAGSNDIVVRIVPENPVVKGQLIAEVAATSCSDAAWRQAGTPAISDTVDGCTYGGVPSGGDFFVCNPKPLDATEVPEFSTWTAIVLGVGLLGLIIVRR